MNARKRLIRHNQHQAISKAETVAFPLPEGKPAERNVFGKQKRWNTNTGKYDIDA